MTKLTSKQKKVMDELFDAEKDENSILDENNVSRNKFNQWLADDAWTTEFDRRIDESKRRAQIIISKFQPTAAIKLVQLTDCEKDQTARQACLDIIQMPRIIERRKQEIESGEIRSLSECTSRGILELLAQDAEQKRKT